MWWHALNAVGGPIRLCWTTCLSSYRWNFKSWLSGTDYCSERSPLLLLWNSVRLNESLNTDVVAPYLKAVTFSLSPSNSSGKPSIYKSQAYLPINDPVIMVLLVHLPCCIYYPPVYFWNLCAQPSYFTLNIIKTMLCSF